MLRFEPLEDRSLPTTLYVISHGLQPDSNQAPAWTQDMAAAISRRLDLGVGAEAIRASIQAFNAPTDAPNPGASNQFLIFNWAAASGFTEPGRADDPAVAGRLANMVRARAAANGGQPLDVHFIGHSRGTYVTLKAVSELNTTADNAALGTVQLTLLDVQDYSAFGQSEAVPLVVPSNVDFAANYFQKVDPFTGSSFIPGLRDDDGIMGGGVVVGALNVDLSNAVRAWSGRTDEFPSHSEVRDWFHWTIDINDADAASIRYLDPALNREQDQFVVQPDTQGRRLIFSQVIDRNTDGQPDDLALGSRTGFFYTLPPVGGVPFNGGLPTAASVGGRPDGAAVLLTPTGGRYASFPSQTPISGVPVRVATADITGDGVLDQVFVAGPGGGPRVVVADGRTGKIVADFFAFEASFTGGLYVAAADLNGDGKAEVVVTPDQGGGPVVAVYDGARLSAGQSGAAAQLARFLGIADPNFRGGARPAFGDVNADGTPDLAVAAGFGGGPRVALFNGKEVLLGTANPARLVGDFFAFEQSLRNGAFVSAGDLDGDGAAELFFGGGPDGSPRVRVVDGKGLIARPPASLDDPSAGGLLRADFFAGDANLRGGVSVSARDVDADGKADLVTASGKGEPGKVRVYKSVALRAGGSPAPDQELDLFSGAVLANGAYVG